jgi:hypothetical protein
MRATTRERMISIMARGWHDYGAGNQHLFPSAEGGGTVG